MKIHLIFHVILLSHITSDFLSSQHQKSQEIIIIKNDEKFWYVNNILNFKCDKCYNSSLLKYYIDWKDYFSTWKFFHLLNNYEQALNEYHLVNSVVEKSHVLSCMMFQCQCQKFKFNLHCLNFAQIWLRSCLNLSQIFCLNLIQM